MKNQQFRVLFNTAAGRFDVLDAQGGRVTWYKAASLAYARAAQLNNMKG